MNTTQIGTITEQKFILYCLENEIPISQPIGNNLPYDFIIEFNNKLLKIQVKTARKGETEGTITFNTRSCSKNYSEVTTSNYLGKIDYFATCWDNKWLFIPIEGASKGEHRICMHDNPKSNQHYYKDYILF